MSQLIATVGELVVGALTLRLQLAKANSDAVSGKLSVCKQVEEALLLGVEPGKLPLHAGVELAQRPLFVVHRFGDPDPQVGDELVRQLHGRVVLLDVLLDLPDGQMP